MPMTTMPAATSPSRTPRTKPSRTTAARLGFFATFCLAVLAASPSIWVASTATAATLSMTGALRNEAGGPIADGKYVMIVALYDDAEAAKPIWDEVQKTVEVSHGQFHVVIGIDEPIDEALIASATPLFFAVQVGAEPELPRVPLFYGARSWYAKQAGTAADLACSGCVKGVMIATGEVTSAHVAFTYAGSDVKDGAALEAKHALVADNATEAAHAATADTAKEADHALAADTATQADSAKKADLAATAEELACTGCVGLKQLNDTVANGFLAIGGGTVTGPTTFEKGVDLAGSALAGARLGGTDPTKAPCTDAEAGRVAASLDGAAMLFCTGKAWKRVRLCTDACLSAGQVACGQLITDDCGEVGACVGKGTLCGAEEACKTNLCVTTLGTVDTPAPTCADILAKDDAAADGLYWLDPNGGSKNDAFQVWCRMGGDYPGAALVIKRPGSVGGNENKSDDFNLPCTPTTAGYCKLSDAKINMLRQVSKHTDAYIVLSYKDGGATPFCRSYAKKSCKWVNNGAASAGCENAVSRDSGQYCSRSQTTASYRGIDGHTCGNLKYPGVTSPDNPFVIFEHSGGSHYCGGWDTAWNRIELLVN